MRRTGLMGRALVNAKHQWTSDERAMERFYRELATA